MPLQSGVRGSAKIMCACGGRWFMVSNSELGKIVVASALPRSSVYAALP